jgi:hypothetical protein
MKKNGLAEWNTLNEEQRNFISMFFTYVCDGKRCVNTNCRNSPFDIMRCPNFKKWRTDIMLKETNEPKEFSLNDYLKELEKIEKGK